MTTTAALEETEEVTASQICSGISKAFSSIGDEIRANIQAFAKPLLESQTSKAKRALKISGDIPAARTAKVFHWYRAIKAAQSAGAVLAGFLAFLFGACWSLSGVPTALAVQPLPVIDGRQTTFKPLLLEPASRPASPRGPDSRAVHPMKGRPQAFF